MTENPYAPPQALVSDGKVDVPEETLKKIRHGWVAALIVGATTFLLSVLAIFGTSILNYSAIELVDAVLACVLAFGIYRKSRVCAVLMLVYFVASKIILIVQVRQAQGLLMAAVFAYYFWQAVSGTFAYHKFMRQGGPAGGTGS